MLKKQNRFSLLLVIANVIVIGIAVYFAFKLGGGRILGLPPYCPDCNVILVSLDTFSANHIPCLGYKRNTAPNLCDFAEKNIMFPNMYSNAHFTLPSHVTMFTGLLPTKHKVNVPFRDHLNPAIPFLPEILHDKGYFTYFDIPFNDNHLPVDRVYNRGIDVLHEDPGAKLFAWDQALKDFESNTDRGQKTFLFLHTYYPHSPYLVEGKTMYTDKKFPNIPATEKQFLRCDESFVNAAKQIIKTGLDKKQWFEYTAKYQKLFDNLAGAKTATESAQVCEDKRNEELINPLRFNYYYSRDNISTPEMVTYLRDLYDQKIKELDRAMTAFFKFISKEKIKKNTIVIITADHGEEFMEHNAIQHQTLYDSNVHIPLIIYIPGVGHQQVNTIAQTADLVPTILDLLGIRNNYKFQGDSIVPDILGTPRMEKYIAAERIYDDTKTVRDGTYKLSVKLVKGQLRPFELYNTKKDPGEHSNILLSHPDIAERLQKALRILLGR